MKRLAAVLVLLLAGCAGYETVPTDELVKKWTWERAVIGKKEISKEIR